MGWLVELTSAGTMDQAGRVLGATLVDCGNQTVSLTVQNVSDSPVALWRQGFPFRINGIGFRPIKIETLDGDELEQSRGGDRCGRFRPMYTDEYFEVIEPMGAREFNVRLNGKFQTVDGTLYRAVMENMGIRGITQFETLDDAEWNEEHVKSIALPQVACDIQF